MLLHFCVNHINSYINFSHHNNSKHILWVIVTAEAYPIVALEKHYQSMLLIEVELKKEGNVEEKITLFNLKVNFLILIIKKIICQLNLIWRSQ